MDVEFNKVKQIRDYLDVIEAPTKSKKGSSEDEKAHVYQLLLDADGDAVVSAITGAYKQKLKQMLNASDSDDAGEDPFREDLPENVRIVVAKMIEMINAIDKSSKGGHEDIIDGLQVELLDYVTKHETEIASLTIDDMPFGKYLHSIAGTEECNNILSGKIRPRLQAMLSGKPLATRVRERLADLGIRSL